MKNSGVTDRFDLNRFMDAQEGVYDRALSELKIGQKQSHWMWYIFPQIGGLDRSTTARYYAIKSEDEARAYSNHPLLGPRLLECTKTVLDIEGRSASAIFGFPDDLKLQSSMTLFAFVSAPNSMFALVLYTFFNGNKDDKTLQVLETMRQG